MRRQRSQGMVAETRGIAPFCEIDELNVWHRSFHTLQPNTPACPRTHIFWIETPLRGLFGNLRVDYAPQTPDQARGDYTPCDLTAKYDIETLAYVKIRSQNSRDGLGTYHAGPESDVYHTHIQILFILRKLSSGNPTLAKPTVSGAPAIHG